MDNELQDLKKRVDHIQYDDIKQIDEQIGELKIKSSNIELLTQQNTEAYKNFSDTLDDFKITLIETTQAIKNSNEISKEQTRAISELKNDIDKIQTNTNARFEEVDRKIYEVDNKSKIDIVAEQTNSFKSFVQKYGGWISTGGIVVGAMIYEIIKSVS